MLHKLSKLGKTLSQAEQKAVHGGGAIYCCEWCSDGSCSGWTTQPSTCDFTYSC